MVRHDHFAGLSVNDAAIFREISRGHIALRSGGANPRSDLVRTMSGIGADAPTISYLFPVSRSRIMTAIRCRKSSTVSYRFMTYTTAETALCNGSFTFFLRFF
jgi:hypothetical protein